MSECEDMCRRAVGGGAIVMLASWLTKLLCEGFEFLPGDEERGFRGEVL